MLIARVTSWLLCRAILSSYGCRKYEPILYIVSASAESRWAITPSTHSLKSCLDNYLTIPQIQTTAKIAFQQSDAAFKESILVDIPYSDSKLYAAQSNNNFSRYNDYRLPTLSELVSIIEQCFTHQTRGIKVFPNTYPKPLSHLLKLAISL